MILRPAFIAPVIAGVAFSSSCGVWKRCAGIFLKEFLKENYDRLWNILSCSSGKGAC